MPNKRLRSATNRPSNADNSNSDNESAMNQVNLQPMEIVYQLQWKVRDQIMTNLNMYSWLLCARPDHAEPEETKERLLRDNLDLCHTLIRLPLKSTLPAGRLNEVVLDLDFSTRSQVIHSLTANYSLVLECAPPDEENKNLCTKLINLPVNLARQSAIPGSADASVLNVQTHRWMKPSELVKMVEEQRSELVVKSSFVSELTEKVDQLRAESQKIRAITSANELKQVVDSVSCVVDVGVNRKTADFECELNGVDAFLESNQPQYSKYFFAGQRRN